jgi:transitional endoplasmic reticulum ATPase
MASSWPQAPLAATPTEYWSESQSTCSWAVSWGAASSPVASPRASDSGKKRSADGGLATEGAVSGGARSFNRFGDNTKDSAAAENAIMQMRKMGVAVPVRFADIAGCDQALVQLKECMEMPMKRPKLFAALGVAPPTGVILYGPSGCGKTLIAQAIGNELGCHIVKIDSAELVSDLAGESELMLRAAFEEARQKQPAVIVIDDIDAAAPARERGAGTSVETRLVTTLQTLMDKVHAGWIPQKRDPGEEPWAPDRVCILGATRQINNVDSALRRAGRFEREVSVRCPDAAGRREMLSVMTRDMVLDDDVELSKVGDQAQGFVGADLAALCRHAGLTAIREAVSLASGKPVIGSDDVPRAGWDDAKITELSQKASQADFVLPVAARHFAAALASRTSRPSVLKEHVPVGQVGRRGWDDVGGLAAQKRDLEELVRTSY